MSKLLIFLCFLVLLSFPIKIAGNYFLDMFDVLTELEELEIKEEDDVFELFDFPSWESPPRNKTLVNVDSFGAVGDGVADDTQAFVNAWDQACRTPNAVLLVPNGKSYLVVAAKFNGPCEAKLVVQIEGTIVAPSDPHIWDPHSPRTWLVFSNLTDVVFRGNGVLEGNGNEWWAQSCKRNKSKHCRAAAPTAFTLHSSSAVRICGLTIQNGQQMNVVISNSQSVLLNNVTVSAPGSSPNTDGIHLTSSTNVVLQNCNIGTGDDCISIVDGCSDIRMNNIRCGPGHGIRTNGLNIAPGSIGSLGHNNSTGQVERVVLDKAYLNGTANGLRIKTYQGGEGFVRSVRFQNVQMENVTNPILIDQFYCDSKKKSPILPSAVQISQIIYCNVTGTSRTKEVMKFACSDTVPCTDITLSNIDLQCNNGTAETYCNSAYGTTKGCVQPPADCLLSSENETEIIVQTGAEHVIHTELYMS